MPVTRTVLIALAATAFAGGALAQTKSAPRKAKPAPAPVTQPRQDQSYLFLSPNSVERKYPSYLTTGVRDMDQPYFNTHVDSTGMRQLPR
ncbi:hypothetical protein NK718_12620 [Alsobacter sp. SYSU M60028]|uniref:Uncharacterized protein n=1 Tax=Alsobacter ponti TaxID=2962936 RepID=A0ABT1LCX5_9HYPH|nr:hypothetical protein [Alsobacter ponti]MCP8939361.1 hypothetical protein [Alsobacter ponti]